MYFVDTVYLFNTCSADPYEIMATASKHGYRLVGGNILFGNGVNITNMDSFASVYLVETLDLTPSDALFAWQSHLTQRNINAQLPTYTYGYSNHLSGMLSGVADIQGMTYFGADCSYDPIMAHPLQQLPLRAPLDYLYNSRLNNMPLHSWHYTQTLLPSESIGHYWANGNEIAAAIAMTILSGSHALMLNAPYLDPPAAELDLVTPLMASLSQLNETLRTGDINGAIVTRDDDAEDSIIDAIVGPKGTLLIALNMKADGYNSILCNIELDQHWIYTEHRVNTVTMELAQPASRVQEMVAGAFVPLRNSTTGVFNSTHLILSNVNLGVDASVVRLFFID
jgi:hypothetical protein